MKPLRILTWHVHGSYLYYLVQSPHQFFLPVKSDRPEGYGGKLPGFAWGDHVQDVPAEAVRHQEFDCILFQSRKNYLEDQYEILSETQRQLPKIFLEHDPPRDSPTDTQHVVDDPNVLLVHVTHFNDLMWNSGRTPTQVIEHGVIVPDAVRYTGELERGVVVVNGLKNRGRRLGADVFDRVRSHVPLDLVGMQSEAIGGLGEIRHDDLATFESRYRFFFNPIRYTSMGLAVCEAMMLGMPIVGLATTEMATVIENGVSGYVDTNVDRLIEVMQNLLKDPAEAQRLSQGARRVAQERFSIHRFVEDWNQAFAWVCDRAQTTSQASVEPSATLLTQNDQLEAPSLTLERSASEGEGSSLNSEAVTLRLDVPCLEDEQASSNIHAPLLEHRPRTSNNDARMLEHQPRTQNIHPSTPNIHASTPNIHPSTQNIQPRTSNIHASTPDIHASTPNIHPSTPNNQPRTLNIHSSTHPLHSPTPNLQSPSLFSPVPPSPHSPSLGDINL